MRACLRVPRLARFGPEANTRRTSRRVMCASTSSRKMLQHGSDRRGHDLAQSADGRQLHRLGQFVDQRHSRRLTLALRPAGQHVDHFLRAHAARHALAARFVAEEAARRSAPCRACSVPSAQTTIAPEPSIEPAAASDLKSSCTSTIDGRQIARRRPGGRECLQLFARHGFRPRD